MGFLPLIAGFALAAGGCAFLIEYEQGSRRFSKRRARRRALTTGLVAALFFLALGLLLVAALLR